MKDIKILLISAISLLCFQNSFSQRPFDTKKMESLISRGIDSAYMASVKIGAYDTIHQQITDGVFSGVVVSEEGHILTVAHAAKPNQIYQVIFPDGTKYLARGMGRIAILGNRRKGLDLAMLKMLAPGKWHFAKMGSNTDMKINQPALSIAYPESFERSEPSVRFGRLASVDLSTDYFVSTCKMEPGDSGGPLFDILGRVIGLHSWIESSEEQNFEVPVDLYKKYWGALNVAKDYEELPMEDAPAAKSAPVVIAMIPAIQDVARLSEKMTRSTVAIQSMRAGKALNILGTLVEYTLPLTKSTYILSKSSMVADSAQVLINGQLISTSVIGRDKDNDLVLLKTASEITSPIRLSDKPSFIDLTHADLGHFMVTALSGGQKKVGVLSSVYVDMPMRFSVGYFGANARFINQKITITELGWGGAASAFLKINDQVTGINGVPISMPPEYGAELMKYLAGDSISVDAIRDGHPIHAKMYLPPFPGVFHVANQFEGGRSARSDGFAKVFIQDAAIKVEECGSSVFDSKGRFVGMNIARHSRTSTVVLPVDVLSNFIKRSVGLSLNKVL